MNKTMKKIILIIIILIIMGGGAFYGGIQYGKSKSPSLKQDQQFSKEKVGKGIGAGSLMGEVIDKDEQSLTLKMPDGGSKIIFFSESTKISKTTDVSIDDIEIGKQIIVSGEQNSDGSYTSKTIQLSPRYFAPKK